MQQPVLHHAKHVESLFGVAMPVIDPRNSEHIAECAARHGEIDAMMAPIERRLVIVPFKIIILHDDTA